MKAAWIGRASSVVRTNPSPRQASAKAATHRAALAEGFIRMEPATLQVIAGGGAKKGDVIGIARIAAIQGAKRTSDLIPLCHPLPITRVAVDFEIDRAASRVTCTAQVETLGRTGGEGLLQFEQHARCFLGQRVDDHAAGIGAQLGVVGRMGGHLGLRLGGLQFGGSGQRRGLRLRVREHGDRAVLDETAIAQFVGGRLLGTGAGGFVCARSFRREKRHGRLRQRKRAFPTSC